MVAVVAALAGVTVVPAAAGFNEALDPGVDVVPDPEPQPAMAATTNMAIAYVAHVVGCMKAFRREDFLLFDMSLLLSPVGIRSDLSACALSRAPCWRGAVGMAARMRCSLTAG
jgi:hypothetical protein